MVRRRLAAAFVTFVVVAGVLASGRSYGWCVPMGRPMPHCCLEALRQRNAERDLAIERHTFEQRSLGRLPAATPAAPELSPGMPALALAAPAPLRLAPVLLLPRWRAHAPSVRPIATGPPFASARCAILSVYRC